jgi:IS5 family transposase
LAHQILQRTRRQKGQKQTENMALRPYRQLIKVTQQTLSQVEQVIPVLQQQKGCQAQQLAETLQHYLPLGRQVIDQTTQRVVEKKQVPAAQKIVSLFEPHTAIIQRGKRPPHETEFGRKLWYSEVDGGIISEYRILHGNPPDEQNWVPSLKNHIQVFGHPPELATADRGVYSPENERVARQLGVKQVALPQPGAKTKRRQKYEKQEWFKAALRFRAGIEGRISGLQRARQLDRCLNRGEEGLARWVGWRIITNNLVVMAANVSRRKRRIKPKPRPMRFSDGN